VAEIGEVLDRAVGEVLAEVVAVGGRARSARYSIARSARSSLRW